MNQRQSRYVAVVCPTKHMPSNTRSAPFIGRPRPPFRFLDLPAEIRESIYDIWIPTILHVSLGLRGVRLQYFRETAGSLCFLTISIRPFFLNRQFYQEFCHTLFLRSTWCFSSANLLAQVFDRIPKWTAERIRHVSMRLISQSTRETLPSTHGDLGKVPPSPFTLARCGLGKMSQLQTLCINLNLADFACKAPIRARDNRFACAFAANRVADFTRVGVQTRVPFVQANLPSEFMNMLRARCGDGSVSVVLKHHDRYAGQMVDVVISPAFPASTPSVMDQMRDEDEEWD